MQFFHTLAYTTNYLFFLEPTKSLALKNKTSTFLTNLITFPEVFLIVFLVLNLCSIVIFFAQLSNSKIDTLKAKFIIKHLAITFTERLIELCYFISVPSFLYYTIWWHFENQTMWTSFIGHEPFSRFSRLFILFCFISVLLFCSAFIAFDSECSLEFPLLFGFSLFFCLFLLSAADFFLIYLILEALTFLTCIIISSNYSSSLALEAAIKYFIISSFSSGFFLYGVFWVFVLTKKTSFKAFLLFLEACPKLFLIWLTELPIFFIIIGFLIKLGAFPFSIWTPDVYEGCSLFITFYLIIVLKTVFILVFAKILFFIFINVSNSWAWILLFSASGSFIFGSLGAFMQKNLKRFFSYSSVNQLGFILLSLCCNDVSTGATGMLIFLIVYVLNNIIFFSVILSLRSSNNFRGVFLITDLKSLSFFYPRKALYLTVALFSFIGLPPLAGFFSKLFILLSSAKSSFFLPVIIALISNAISSFYYIRLLAVIWFQTQNSINSHSFFFEAQNNKTSEFFILFSVFFNIFFIFWIDTFINILQKIVLN